MRTRKTISWCALLAALISGTLIDRSHPNPPLRLGAYEVLAGDFHVHSFPWSWATLSPFDTVLEARRQNLDVIALTPHNHVWVAQAGRWFSEIVHGPIVLAGEEIHALDFHVLGIGINRTISWNQPADQAIQQVHDQGGVAIAAHPMRRYWNGYNGAAMRLLDGAEVVHPVALTSEEQAVELRQFYQQSLGGGHLTAIGDSDYHGLGPMGLCRTYIFVSERTPRGVLEALREGHTVVYDGDQVYGDPELIRLAAQDGRLPAIASTQPASLFFARFSRVAGVLGLAGLALL